MEHSFDGIKEKLKRSNEHIANLKFEISRFFEECEYPILPENDKQSLLDAVHYHQQLLIPPRFSVLAGEIIHQLRSCLDHVAWIFSSDEYRERHPRKIEFPVFEEKPVDKDSIKRYEGKIKGITNPKVLSLIEELQPYKTPDPVESLIFILHTLDVIDKHREVFLTYGSGMRQVPKDMEALVEACHRQHPELAPVDLALHFKGYGNLIPNISFRNFGRRTIQPIVPALIELNNEVVRIVSRFNDLLPR
jgi:hypothetical protein